MLARVLFATLMLCALGTRPEPASARRRAVQEAPAPGPTLSAAAPGAAAMRAR